MKKKVKKVNNEKTWQKLKGTAEDIELQSLVKKLKKYTHDFTITLNRFSYIYIKRQISLMFNVL